MRFSKSYISKYNLKLKKIKTCQSEEINKDYKIKKVMKNISKKILLKEVLYDF